ncbi:MAG: glycosyl hydrolase 53 family protein, partial [Lachnospiraceae bacterium]|nr:glycosyl hydrolase 53 family protein [Lachnospiraceae bacterium]
MKRRSLLSILCVITIISAGLLTSCSGQVSEIPDQNNTEEKTEEVNGGTTVEQTYFPELPTDMEEAGIFVQKIDNIPEGFIRGMDISSLLSEEASGVKYYDENGEEQDLLKILADSGINCVRVRVWVDPFDEEGKGFGGGNCTA